MVKTVLDDTSTRNPTWFQRLHPLSTLCNDWAVLLLFNTEKAGSAFLAHASHLNLVTKGTAEELTCILPVTS